MISAIRDASNDLPNNSARWTIIIALLKETSNNQHAGNRGRRIPDDQFRTHFGREHHFHVQREQVVNVSQPVVVYGGYSWQLAEPWPSDWSYDDDCYIDEVDGEYFLFDALHPGIRIAVFIAD